MSAIVLELCFDCGREAGAYSIELRYGAPDDEALRSVARGTVVLPIAELEALHGDLPAYGARLTTALFADPRRAAVFDYALNGASLLDLPLRLRVQVLPKARELNGILWEAIRGTQPDRLLLCDDPRVRITRYVEPHGWTAASQRSLRQCRMLLLVGAVDSAGTAVDPLEEKGLVEQAVAPIPVDLFDPAEMELARKLRKGYDFLYVACHSVQQDGKWHPALAMTDIEIAAALEGALLRPRLAIAGVLLSRAHLSGGSAEWAGRLAEAGITGVVTLSVHGSPDAARAFVRELFRRIEPCSRVGQGQGTRFTVEIDSAIGEARQAVGNVLPVAYFSQPDTRLSWYRPYFTQGTTPYWIDEWPHWDTVRAHFRRDKYTPILGPGLLEPLVGSWKVVARQLAANNEIPLVPHAREDLMQVAQYIALCKSPAALYDKLAREVGQALSTITPVPPALEDEESSLKLCDHHFRKAARKLRERSPEDAHALLARLRLSTYFTTSPTAILEDALGEAERPASSTTTSWRSRSRPRTEASETCGLTGAQIKRLTEELVRAFTMADLERMTKFELNHDLEDIKGVDRLDKAFHLVLWAEEKGKIPQLLAGARKSNSTFCFDSAPQLGDAESVTPSRSNPLVHHVFGGFDREEELVLTQDDYFEYLATAGAGMQGGSATGSPLLPVALRERLANSGLIFLGFQLTDWSFRVLFQSVLRLGGLKAGERYKHVAVQLDPEGTPFINVEAAAEYLQALFPLAESSIFWGSAEDFLLELIQQLRK